MKNKGITLIALVITIIVLLIITGITISELVSNDSIIVKTQKAKEENLKNQIFEEMKLKIYEIQTEKRGNATLKDVVEYFKNDGENEYILSLTLISSIKGDIPDVSNANELYVIYKGYQFKIKSNLEIEIIDKAENEILEKNYIIYDCNGGENGPEPQDKNNITISNIKPEREGYVFIGWGTNKNDKKVLYKSGENYNGNSSITLYALWGKKIDYIESNGIQYIDTDFYPNQDTSIEFVAQSIKDKTSAWFGSRSSSVAMTQNNAFAFWNIDSKFRSDYGNEYIQSLNIDNDKIYTINKEKNVTYINDEKVVDSEYKNFSTPSSLTLFGAKTNISSSYNDKDGIDSRMSILKLYSCKIKDNKTLVRDFVPICDLNGVECLFDLIDSKIYYFNNVYEETEYITTNGSQYVDTGILPNQDTTVEFIAEALSENTTSGWFGARSTPNTENNKSFCFWQIVSNFRSDYDKTIGKTIQAINITKNTIYQIKKEKNKTFINGVQYTNDDYNNFQSNATLTLFAIKTYQGTDLNSANSVDRRIAKLKFYNCKIWQNDELIREYIVVKDNSGTKYLFDKVSSEIINFKKL